MITFYILLGPVIGISLFILFVLSRHDFAILRRNITLIQIFDKVLLATIVGLLLGRLVHIFNSKEFYLFHLLAFFHIIRNSGFSVFGFFIGLIFATMLLFRKSKIMFRMLDIIMLSFFPVAILNAAIGNFVIKNIFINYGVVTALLIVFIYLLRLNSKNKVKDGLIACILISLLSVSTILANINLEKGLMHFSFSQVLAIVFFVWSIAFGIYLQILKKKK